MTRNINFSALPSDASARLTRFDLSCEPDKWPNLVGAKLVPVALIKEWQWPRNNAGFASNEPVFRTVRISEHRWPLYKTTFMCDGRTNPMADRVEWPEPPPPVTREYLCTQPAVDGGYLVIPAEWYQPDVGDAKVLEMDETGYAAHFRHHNYGNREPNDGLPEDYLEFWMETEDTDA